MDKIKKIIFAVLLYIASMVVIIHIVNANKTKIVIVYEPEELKQEIEADHPNQLFIDLRDRKDYEAAHISGFMNWPCDDGKSVLDYLEENELKNKDVVLMCYSGNRAAKCANYLTDNGVKNIEYVKFGYDEFASTVDGFRPEKGQCDCLAK